MIANACMGLKRVKFVKLVQTNSVRHTLVSVLC